jgi:hypothetical protein
MCDENALNLLENKISDCRIVLYDVQTFVRLGALASDSGIIDDDLQLHKSFDDYYILLRTINQKLQKAINILHP